MTGAFLSEMWYRVAPLRPQLHPHVRIFRQRYRGAPWYVLQDRSAARVHRFTPATYALIAAMDGRRSVDQLWTELAATLGEHAPRQDEVIDVLYRLHAADLLQSGTLPDPAEAILRKRRQTRAVWLRNLVNPMALRLPLWDPQRFLDATWPVVRPLFGPLAAALWLAVVGAAALLAARHWPALSGNLADRVLGLENLVLLWLTYPVVKLAHELGHAYAVRHGGGEVHEMGVMFLVFAPIPYVDASAAAAFRGKWQRIGVAGAGIVVELFLAALALFVWLLAEPGAVRAVAFNVMLIGGVSTVLFNANPLLRFDGYFMLADFLEIPNLATRASQYLAYLVKRYAFGRQEARSPAQSADEARWLALYAPLAWVYRLLVMLAIALFVAAQYFFVGVLLALWSVASMLVWPLVKGVAFVCGHAELDRQRRRALWVSAAALGTLVLLAGALPLPYWTNAEAVVWLPPNAEVRAGSAGFVERVWVAPGRSVAVGEVLLQLRDPELAAELAARAARVEQFEVQLASEMFAERLKAEVTRQTLATERALLARAESRSDALVAFAGRAGEWVVASPDDLPGRFYAQGALIGYVAAGAPPTLRAVVGQEEADLVRGHTRAIGVRFPDRPWQTLAARLAREVPGGSERLPAKALTLEGGGPFATDPRDGGGLKTLSRTFQFDLDLAAPAEPPVLGMRALVRFEHEPQPLAVQAYRRLRQVLLSQLTV